MSTIDRSEVYRDRCLCGNGEIVIVESSPDHPYVRGSQYGWETTITCSDCKKNYTPLQVGFAKVLLYRSEDLKKQMDLSRQWRSKLDEATAYAESRGFIDRLVEYIDARSIAEVHRQIGQITSGGDSYSTFRRNFNKGGTTKVWVKSSITGQKLAQVFEKCFGIKDPKLNEIIRQSEQLFVEYQKEPNPIKVLL